MKSKFRSFVADRTPEIMEMAMGRSSDELILPTSHAMECLLSVLKGNGVKARALDWLMFDGMYLASKGRKELCRLVNEAIGGNLQGDVLKMSGPTTAIGQSDGRRAMMRAEARSPMAYHGEDPDGPNGPEGPVQESDLFSRRGWERRPELGRLQLHGMGILDYYDKYLEPRVMYIDYQPGMKAKIELDKMREFMKSMNMEPFRYGSYIDPQTGAWQDGYIEFLEKGTGLHPAFQGGVWSNNGHNGWDMRLDDKSRGDDSQTLPPVGVDSKGRPQMHFVQGSYTKDAKRSSDTIGALTSKFATIAHQVQNNAATPNVHPELAEKIKGLLGLRNDIKKAELSYEQKNFHKASAANALMGVPDRVAKYVFDGNADFNLDKFLEIVRKGLAAEWTRNANTFGNVGAFGPQWDGQGPKPQDGYWYDSGNGKITVKFPAAVQERIFDYITAPVHQNAIRVEFGMNKVFPEAKPRPDANVVSTALFNKGVEANPTMLADFKRVIYTAPDFKLKKQGFVSKVVMAPKEVVNPDKPWEDPVLAPLWDKGYRWKTKNGREGAAPNWGKDTEAYLSLGEDMFSVVHDRDSGKFFLMAPTEAEGEKFEPASFGLLGSAMLGGGVAHSGGLKGGHIRATMAGPKTNKRLIDLLLRGGFGENQKVNNEMDLRCVQDAIRTAKYKYAAYTFREANKVNFSDYELLGWAVEGLHSTLGHRSAQVGYITPHEIEAILKWDANKELEMYEKGRWAKVEPGEGNYAKDRQGNMVPHEGGDFVENPDWEEGDGWGVQSILRKNGVVGPDGTPDPEMWQMIIDTVQDAFKEDSVFDYDSLPGQVDAELRPWAMKMRKILGENAYKARVRDISKYVVSRMMRKTHAEAEMERRVTQFSALDSTTADGQTKGFEGDHRTQGSRGAYYDDPDQYGLADPKELRKAWGIEEPPQDPDRVAPERPTATFDRGMIRPPVKMAGAPETSDFKSRKAAYLASKNPTAAQQPAPKPAAAQQPAASDFSSRKAAYLAAKNKAAPAPQPVAARAASSAPPPAAVQQPAASDFKSRKAAYLAAKRNENWSPDSNDGVRFTSYKNWTEGANHGRSPHRVEQLYQVRLEPEGVHA